MSHRCDLCGEFYETGRLFVAAQASACNDCISSLIDNESDRRANQSESLRSQSGDQVLANVQSIAQAVK